MIKFVDLVYPIRIFRRLCYELRNKPIFFARWIVLSPEKVLRSHLSKFIIRSVQFTKIVETRRDTGAEKIPFQPRKVRPAIFGQKRFVTPPPNYTFHPLQRFHLSFFFPFLLRISPVLLSLSLSVLVLLRLRSLLSFSPLLRLRLPSGRGEIRNGRNRKSIISRCV